MQVLLVDLFQLLLLLLELEVVLDQLVESVLQHLGMISYEKVLPTLISSRGTCRALKAVRLPYTLCL